MRKLAYVLGLALVAMLGLASPASASASVPDWDLAPAAARVLHGTPILDGHAYKVTAGKVVDLGRGHEVKPNEQIKTSFNGKPRKVLAANGCPEEDFRGAGIENGYLCFYKDINWNSGRWQGSQSGFAGGPLWPVKGPCWNLSGSSYTTGGTVNNTAGSVQVTAGDFFQFDQGEYWVVFDWVSCQSAGDFIFYVADAYRQNSTLQWADAPGDPVQSWYHNPTSVQYMKWDALAALG